MTISLDSLDREKFLDITGVDALRQVLRGDRCGEKLTALIRSRSTPCAVRGRNDDEVVDMAGFCCDNGMRCRCAHRVHAPRQQATSGAAIWVVPGKEIHDAINAVYPLQLKQTSRGSETAWKYEFADGARRDRHYRPCDRDVLRRLLAHPPHCRRPDPHMSFSTTEHNLRDCVAGSIAGRDRFLHRERRPQKNRVITSTTRHLCSHHGP